MVVAEKEDRQRGSIIKNKSTCIRLLFLRMFNATFVGVDVLGDPQQTNFGRDIVFSTDLCYNEANEKPSSGRKVARGA